MEAIEQTRHPSLRTRFVFWLTVTAISVFFAEVLAGSDMFPFYHGWGLMVVCPLYGLHCLVLGRLVFRAKKIDLPLLWTAGVIFGLYEAYITKVLWNPPWPGTVWHVGQVAVVELLVIGMFWHPFISFILPLTICETILTSSRRILTGLPNWARRFLESPRRLTGGMVAFAVLMGTFQSINSASPLNSVLSAIGTAVPLAVLVWFLRRQKVFSAYPMNDLLPNGSSLWIMLLLLITLYTSAGIFLRPDALPGLTGHLTIWLIYLIFIGLIAALMLRQREVLPEMSAIGVEFNLKKTLLLAGLLMAASAITKWALGPAAMVVVVIVWFAMGLGSLSMLTWSILSLRRMLWRPSTNSKFTH